MKNKIVEMQDQIQKILKEKYVAIAGLGGLGSNIAMLLVRSGVGHLMLVDFDTVEKSNLNRQQYLPRHIGMWKTDALAEQLWVLNPELQLSLKRERITADNAVELFMGWSFICEAMDTPDSKAMLLNTLLPDESKIIVAASGMAGYGSANQIKTVRKMHRLYLCGDGYSDVEQMIMLAPRVQLCASHQANMVLRLLLGERDA